jgi:hypothetical protein
MTTRHSVALACYLAAFLIQIGATYSVFKTSRIARRAASVPIVTDNVEEQTFTLVLDGVESFIKAQAIPLWYLLVLVGSAFIDLAGNWLSL